MGHSNHNVQCNRFRTLLGTRRYYNEFYHENGAFHIWKIISLQYTRQDNHGWSDSKNNYANLVVHDGGSKQQRQIVQLMDLLHYNLHGMKRINNIN